MRLFNAKMFSSIIGEGMRDARRGPKHARARALRAKSKAPVLPIWFVLDWNMLWRGGAGLGGRGGQLLGEFWGQAILDLDGGGLDFEGGACEGVAFGC